MSNLPGPTETSFEKETARLEAFSDGVFAIAITLLVMEIKVPHLGEQGFPPTSMQLSMRLVTQWPSYFAFVTSFFTVLVMWVHHHAVFRLVRRVDTNLLYSNGLLLLFVTAVPFPTAILAEYLLTPAAGSACAAYAGSFVLIALAFYLLVLSAFRPSIREPSVSAETVVSFRRNYRVGPPLYLAATLGAFYSPYLCMAICSGLWIFWVITTRAPLRSGLTRGRAPFPDNKLVDNK
jgi:uncharacterized membrane protein